MHVRGVVTLTSLTKPWRPSDAWPALVHAVGTEVWAHPRCKHGNVNQKKTQQLMTLTAHVHQAATVLRPVLRGGLTVAHMPLVRSIFEATMTVVWCDKVADGANALTNEGSSQRKNLRDTLATTHSMSELASKISVGAGGLPTSSDQQARRLGPAPVQSTPCL